MRVPDDQTVAVYHDANVKACPASTTGVQHAPVLGEGAGLPRQLA